jgi:hypothetical protein
MRFVKIKKIVVSLAIIVTGGVSFATMVPQTVAAADNPACVQRFLGFPVWYRGLSDKNCNVVSPDGQNGNPTLSNFIWHIVLNVIEIVMMLVGYLAVFFILYGGFQFLTSQGAPDAAAKARTTITNAVIGLVISIVAVAVVNFIVAGLSK